MPTTADIERRRNYSYPAIHSWTDDLPVCRKSGVGFATNQVYREDGHRQEKHPFEDTSFHSGSKEDGGTTTYLYGVFDGHYGIEAAQFAVQGLAAELLLGQLSGKIRDQDIKEALSQAFVAVEKNYLESLDDLVAKRTSLQFQIPDGITSYEAYQNYPHIVDQINSLNGQLSCGTTAVVALIVGTRLYVANVGDSRALLCKTDKHGVHKVVQVSADHNLTNEDEILRLYNLGLDFTPASRKSCCTLGNQENTRCLGNYLVKGAYREFEELAPASEEPIIAEPEIQGGIELDESCCFLLLMSAGLYKSLEEATDSTQVNKDIVQMAIAELLDRQFLKVILRRAVDYPAKRPHHLLKFHLTLISQNFIGILLKLEKMAFFLLNLKICYDDNFEPNLSHHIYSKNSRVFPILFRYNYFFFHLKKLKGKFCSYKDFH
ncbi:TGF-beta-activated kinase 1 and MAP3K7-binding protein 1-like isoform X2 [Rhodnius prolixus]|uniref:TGF-beta-activated kinase 1 and MAP3K7-binding protein 1-like isoform X2 n=1 Tax=Rhodnius prolixus TaxID=13249 RepID=UPI003D18A2E2